MSDEVQQQPVDRLMLRFIELKARKRELDALVKECNKEVEQIEPALLDWFATTGNTQVKNVLGTVFVVNDLFVGLNVGEGDDKQKLEERLFELLDEHQVADAVETRISWAELRRRVKAALKSKSDGDDEGLDPEIMELLKVTPSTSLSVRLA